MSRAFGRERVPARNATRYQVRQWVEFAKPVAVWPRDPALGAANERGILADQSAADRPELCGNLGKRYEFDRD